jgi:hypothetical protein
MKPHRGNGLQFKEGSKCNFSLRAAHTQGITQSIQRGNGTLHAGVRFDAKLTVPCHDTPPTVSIPARWMKVQGTFKMQAHITSRCVVMDIAAFKVSHSIDTDATALRAARVRSTSIGAMDESSRNVQKANTLPQTAHTKHTLSSARRWMKCHGRFKMQALTNCDTKVMSTCTTAGQFKGQFKGAMDEEGLKMRTLTCCDAKITSTRTAAGQFKGATVEMS